MAQQGNNGGGNNPVLPFGYDPNYLQPRQSSSSEPPRQQNLHHHHQQQQYNQSAQAVLNDSDDAFIQSFFQNPDGANSTEDIHNVAWSLDQKPPEHPNFGSWDFNAAQNTALTNRSQGSFQPQAQQHGQQPQHMDGFYQQQMTGAASDADMLSGASSLFNLSNQQQQQQDASGGTGFGGASWGNFAAGVGHVLAGPENLQSPLTSSGRQSSGGSLYTPTSGSLSQQQLGQHLQFQQMMRDQQHGQGRHQSQPQNVHQQPQPQPQHHVPHQGQHTRHPSLQLDTAHTGMFQMFQQNQGNASWLAQQALQFTPQQNQGAQRPSMLRFGTDSMVQGPHSYRSDMSQHPEQKASNLMGVPLADQAAAGSHSPSMQQQMQDFRPAFPYGIRGSGSEAPTRPNSAGAGPPMTAFGNMSMTSPMSAMTARPGTSWDPYSGGGGGGGGSGDDSYQQGPSRKRRKSQTEREESATVWSPPSAARGNIPKRGPKVPKADEVAEGEEPSSLDAMTFPSQHAHQTPKRRKSTMTHGGRPSFSGVSMSSVSPSGSIVTAQGPDSSAMTAVPVTPPTSHSAKKGKSRESKQSARQNLTEDQKRANHIQSEQKRRNIIKQGYDDLNGLVPSLAGGKSGFSKSEILKEVVAYMEAILSGNAAVEELIKDRAGGNGTSTGDGGLEGDNDVGGA